jgi:protoheme IX farnesyltransferase
VLGNDYEKAGFPTLTRIFNSIQLSRITFIWILATAVTSLLIPLFGIVKHPGFYLALLASGIWLTWNASKLFRVDVEKINFRFAFKDINIFVLLVMLIISLDQILIFA